MLIYRWDKEGGEWRSMPLEAGATFLSPAAILLSIPGGRCALLTREADVTVNGIRPLSIHVLADKDEIRLGEELVYFSRESEVRVAPFAGREGDVLCGRCKGRMRQGESSVRCRCGSWHHQSCWTYDVRCSSCDQRTAGISWVPEPVSRKRKRERTAA